MGDYCNFQGSRAIKSIQRFRSAMSVPQKLWKMSDWLKLRGARIDEFLGVLDWRVCVCAYVCGGRVKGWGSGYCLSMLVASSLRSLILRLCLNKQKPET